MADETLTYKLLVDGSDVDAKFRKYQRDYDALRRKLATDKLKVSIDTSSLRDLDRILGQKKARKLNVTLDLALVRAQIRAIDADLARPRRMNILPSVGGGAAFGPPSPGRGALPAPGGGALGWGMGGAGGGGGWASPGVINIPSRVVSSRPLLPGPGGGAAGGGWAFAAGRAAGWARHYATRPLPGSGAVSTMQALGLAVAADQGARIGNDYIQARGLMNNRDLNTQFEGAASMPDSITRFPLLGDVAGITAGVAPHWALRNNQNAVKAFGLSNLDYNGDSKNGIHGSSSAEIKANLATEMAKADRASQIKQIKADFRERVTERADDVRASSTSRRRQANVTGMDGSDQAVAAIEANLRDSIDAARREQQKLLELAEQQNQSAAVRKQIVKATEDEIASMKSLARAQKDAVLDPFNKANASMGRGTALIRMRTSGASASALGRQGMLNRHADELATVDPAMRQSAMDRHAAEIADFNRDDARARDQSYYDSRNAGEVSRLRRESHSDFRKGFKADYLEAQHAETQRTNAVGEQFGFDSREYAAAVDASVEAMRELQEEIKQNTEKLEKNHAADMRVIRADTAANYLRMGGKDTAANAHVIAERAIAAMDTVDTGRADWDREKAQGIGANAVSELKAMQKELIRGSSAREMGAGISPYAFMAKSNEEDLGEAMASLTAAIKQINDRIPK